MLKFTPAQEKSITYEVDGRNVLVDQFIEILEPCQKDESIITRIETGVETIKEIPS